MYGVDTMAIVTTKDCYYVIGYVIQIVQIRMCIFV